MLGTPIVFWQTVNKPDEIQYNAAFHQCLHCLLILKQPSGAEINYNLENSSCDPLKYTMGSLILIVSISMENPSSYKELNKKGVIM